MSKPIPEYRLAENMQWLCGCGEWVEDLPGHCPKCGHDAPWGCDCSDCTDFDEDCEFGIFECGEGCPAVP